MKTKFFYTALLGLLASSGMSNAAELLTDGRTQGQPGQMTSYQGSANSSSSLVEGEVNFTDFAQKKVNATLKLSDTDYLRVEGSIKYMGQNLGIMTDFLSYLSNYKLGMGTPASTREIVISEQDNVNIAHFSKYFCENLLNVGFENQTVTPEEFTNFKWSRDKAFDSFNYNSNFNFFALTNYLEKSEAKPVEIKHTRNNYNHLRFIFSPCSPADIEKGTQVNSHFKIDDVPSGAYGTKIAKIPSVDTIMISLIAYTCTNYEAKYNITLFKVEEDTFRMNVKLSSKDFGGSQEYKPRQVSNILLQIKK